MAGVNACADTFLCAADTISMNLGLLYFISAPSGAVKTSLVRILLELTPDLALSISHTTQPMRPGERDGIDYHFVAVETFQAMVAAGAGRGCAGGGGGGEGAAGRGRQD